MLKPEDARELAKSAVESGYGPDDDVDLQLDYGLTTDELEMVLPIFWDLWDEVAYGKNMH